MAFTSISSRISNMPLVLVGPILRKVTDSSVSVFIVTKESKTVTLSVFDSENNVLLSRSASTVQLGEHIHVLVITASGNDGTLYPNHVFHYNISFNGVAMIQSNGTLTDGVLVNATYSLPEGITYSSHVYPTFVLPASDKNLLKFVHGSCRKPHGGKTDALRGLDTILSSTITSERGTPNLTPNSSVISEINQRPQLLCLTGDQIYADDVADALLHMLIDAETNLYNWGASNQRENLPENPTTENLKPGNRQKLIAPRDNEIVTNKITSSGSYAKSHLLRLAEFYSMYLFAWSDVLWPVNDNDLPGFSVVYPGVSPTREIPAYNGALVHRPARQEATEKSEKFSEELQAIKEFKKGLKFVRRSLANIPSYMMFDDHEITDDWFLTQLWVQNAMNPNTLVKRLIQNGLSAFAVFQAWGNTPERFASGNGALILAQLESLNTNGGNNESVFNSLGSLMLPQLNATATKLENGFPWHYHIDFNVFRLIVLDTRTLRGYKRSEAPPALIHTSEIQNQINSNTNKDLAVIVSPAPVFGNIAIEDIQVLTTLFYYRNPYEKDYEAWVFHQASFQELLHRIAAFSSSILLSGDVHYGFSASIQYWNNRSGTNLASGIAQLCSSSLKNSDTNTEIASYSRAFGLRVRPNSFSFLGWDSPGSHISVDHYSPRLDTSTGRRISVRGTPAIWEIEDPILQLHNTPDWRYRIYFETDARNSSNRLENTPVPLSSSNSQAQAGYRHYNSFRWRSHRYVVGRDNIGMVKLKENGSKLDHEFWYVMGDRDAADNFVPQSSTEHEVICGPPGSSVPLPGN